MPGFGGGGGMMGMMGKMGGGDKGEKKKPGKNPIDEPIAEPKQFHKGGRVRKSGWAKVRKGERVLTKAQVKGRKKAKRKRV